MFGSFRKGGKESECSGWGEARPEALRAAAGIGLILGMLGLQGQELWACSVLALPLPPLAGTVFLVPCAAWLTPSHSPGTE